MGDLQLLISTMHQTDHTLLERMRVSSDAVVVNQCDKDETVRFQYNGYNITWINSTERGLSKSRNMALRAATAEICVLADDDLEYCDDYANTILRAFQDNKNADIIRFEIEGIERKFKQYDHIPRQYGYLGVQKMSSVEIAFRRRVLAEKGIWFNELIGAGTKYLMGEESALLVHCLKKKMAVRYYPTVVARLHIGTSTWFRGFNSEYFVGRGAAYAAMDRSLSPALIFQFAVRKRKRYKENMSPLSAMRYMFQGRNQYMREVKEYDT